MFLLIKFTLLYAVVLMLVAMGGMFSERSGVINIALEGIMAIGGLAGVFVLVLFPDLPAPALVALSILASAVSGMIYSLLLGFSAITLKADQTIGGTALNMLATAIAIVLVKAFNNGSDAGNGAASAKLNYTNAAFIYKIGPFTVNIFLFIGIILLICSYVFLFKTKWGLRLRACGEHPQAADSVGINVYQWRYTGVIISGALGGIGGFAYIVPSVTTWNFEVCVNQYYTKFVAEKLKGSDVKVCTVVGFPLGMSDTRVKAFETRAAIEDGAQEVDMVINVGALKDGKYDFVRSDIQTLKEVCGKDIVLKVIIETCLLTDEEKVKACELAKEAGADFVKTSTGFSTGGAKAADVALMRKTVGPDMGVKASGGIHNADEAQAMVDAGASRLGTSATLAIIG